jgi:hypothetical protein
MTPSRGFEQYQNPTPVNERTQGQSPKPRLSPETVAQLREALKDWIEGDRAETILGNALHAAAREARDRGIRAEELLVTLKTTWFEVGGAPTVPHSASPSDQKRLDELVTACIKAYYE